MPRLYHSSLQARRLSALAVIVVAHRPALFVLRCDLVITVAVRRFLDEDVEQLPQLKAGLALLDENRIEPIEHRAVRRPDPLDRRARVALNFELPLCELDLLLKQGIRGVEPAAVRSAVVDDVL